ncbi:MAG: endopeptidase La [Proteobacteria bacterium]|nr:endopeptidase La [Pseudomonadota bacterium]
MKKNDKASHRPDKTFAGVLDEVADGMLAMPLESSQDGGKQTGVDSRSTQSKPADQVYPVLPLRDIVVFPHMIAPLLVARPKSVRALEAVMNNDMQVVLVTQRNIKDDAPEQKDLYEIGTLGGILQLVKLPDGSIKVLVEGRGRVGIKTMLDNGRFLQAEVSEIADDEDLEHDDLLRFSREALQGFEEYIKFNQKVPSEAVVSFGQIESPGKLCDSIASHMMVEVAKKQELLEAIAISRRFKRILEIMHEEIGALKVDKRVRNRVRKQMEKSQRDYYLHEQIKAIQKELGDGDDGVSEIAEMEGRIKAAQLIGAVKEKVGDEFKKLKNMSPMSAEATVVRNYIDTLLALPWRKRSRIKTDIVQARKVLDDDHYGLEKVKDRIIEYLAVQCRTKKIKGPILCLVGPPGVGKTSLGKSVAKATGRTFGRLALGGVRDESEIRGHRRTYIGSMPGKIIQCIRKAKSKNPLLLLDEVDKLGYDWRGDPASALLEVLDPEQNNTFQDHYIEVNFDLSEVMFITTANTLNMARPLLDRMEVIRLAGYTEDEKVEIANRHLIPKQLKEHGLKNGEITIQEDALRFMIQRYTRESGVRNIEREIAKLARKVITQIVKGELKTATITKDNVEGYLGVPKYIHSEIEKENMVGVTTGLAWTEVGGEVLNIEAVIFPGTGKVTATGKLGDVMKESVQAAEYYIKSRANVFGISPDVLSKHDIHVHIPEGATPKDGPSAGIALVTSIISALTGNAVRSDIAMTGELTLRGRVLQIGGLKEKLLAAERAGIKTVLIPKDNIKDLAEVPEKVKQALTIVPMTQVDQVLVKALVEKPIALTTSDSQSTPLPPRGHESENSEITTH